MTESAIIVSGGAYITPVVDVKTALVRYQTMKEFISAALRQDVDFGVIPGTNKPTLLKPGAEKLSGFFGLAPRFEIVEKDLDWTGERHGDESFFYFHYRCRLMHGESLAAEGEGSASSWEKKYRYRLSEIVCPSCEKPAIKRSKFPPRNNPNGEPGWYCHDKAGGCGAQFDAGDKRITDQPRGQVKNPDAADVVNTIQKMGQKRAFVAAVLLAVNGSEYFTQDVEDFIDAEFTVQHPTEKSQPGAAQYNATPAQVEQPTPEPVKQTQAEPSPAGINYPAPNAKIGKHVYPQQWARLFAAYTRANQFEVDGILQKLNLPGNWNPEEAVDAVNRHLDAKDAK